MCMHPRIRRHLLLAGLVFVVGSSAAADQFPTKPITLVVGLAAGGGTDVQARALARAAAKELGQPIIVENRVGVAGTLGPASVARRSAPDGYTLAVTPITVFRMPHLMNVNFDPTKDFTYIANITSYSYSLSVGRDSPWRSLSELLTFAKTHPGKVSYAASGIGGTGHITITRLAKLAGVEFNVVPYKSSAECFAAVMGGHVDFTAEGGFGAPLDGGQIRSLGVFSDERLKNRPSIPTIKEQGYDVVSKSSWGIAGPKEMDAKVVEKLAESFRKASADPDFLRILAQEDQPITFMGSEQYTARALELFAEEGRFVKDLGMKKSD